MADALTISTGIGGFLSLTLQIAQILLKYTSEFKSAPKDAQTLLTEVIELNRVLQQLQKFLEKENIKANFQETSALCDVISLSEGKIKNLNITLKKFERSGFKDRLRWPFHRQECIDATATLHHCIQIIEFSLTIGNCKKYIDSTLLFFKDVPAEMPKLRDSITEVLKSVSEIDKLAIGMHEIKSGVQEVKSGVQEIKSGVQEIKNAAQSLQRNIDAEYMEKLLAWLSPLEPQKRHQDVKATRIENTGNWVLHHFRPWLNRESSSDQVLGCYGEPGTGKTVLASILIDYVSSISNQPATNIIYLYCDYRDQKEQFRSCFTARPHVQDQVQLRLGIVVTTLTIVAQKDDIQKYLMHHINSDPYPDAMNDALKEEILETLPEMSDGMFLLPALHIDVILDKLTVSKRRFALRNLPPGLYAAYEGTTARIQQSPSRGELGMKGLMWMFWPTDEHCGSRTGQAHSRIGQFVGGLADSRMGQPTDEHWFSTSTTRYLYVLPVIEYRETFCYQR
ncbi:hypothetical protein BDZ91DRAFT_848653 [Kalaharituber pfeilii]|nr:hypothetical protein BDZ91DRAFT_848653 [Kalaharituber pfeilii]